MEILLSLFILIYSAILHEIAHGLVAERLGDPTARLLGRITLNPKSHIDPIMSIIVPLMLFFSNFPVLFGAAKPVPVDPFNLRDGRKDLALISLAGPLTNVLIAFFASLIIRFITFPQIYDALSFPVYQFLSFFFSTTVLINLYLAIFNLLPIPPLDGSKIFSLLLSNAMEAKFMSLSRYGFLILLFIYLTPIGSYLFTLVHRLVLILENILLP